MPNFIIIDLGEVDTEFPQPIHMLKRWRKYRKNAPGYASQLKAIKRIVNDLYTIHS